MHTLHSENEAMSKRYLIQCLGGNRAGILAAITTGLSELGGDMVGITQDVLHGYATMTILADFPEHRKGTVIESHLASVTRAFDFSVTVKEFVPLERMVALGEPQPLTLHISGKDAPGILRGVCALLAQQQVDIHQIQADSNDDGRTFRTTMLLCVPDHVAPDELASQLDELASLNGLTMTLGDSEEVLTIPRF